MGLIRTHYLDASATVKLFINEDGGDTLRNYVAKHSIFYMTSFCVAETFGVLKRKYLRNEITQDQYLSACDRLVGQLRDEVISVHDIYIADRQIYSEVEKIAKRYSLDISDAFQVISLKKGFFSPLKGTSSECILITGDKQLANVARQENLRVWDCVREPPP